jgi:hypothetical protein
MSSAVDQKPSIGPDACLARSEDKLGPHNKHGEVATVYPEPTPEEERELLRKIDLYVLPMVPSPYDSSMRDILLICL